MSELDNEIKAQQKEHKKLIKQAKEQKEYAKYLKKLSKYYVIFCSVFPVKKESANSIGSYKGYAYTYYLNTPKFLRENQNTYVPSDAMFPDQSGRVKFDDVDPHFTSRNFLDINTAMEIVTYNDFLFTKHEALEFIEQSEYPKIMRHNIIPAKDAHPNNLFFQDF